MLNRSLLMLSENIEVEDVFSQAGWKIVKAENIEQARRLLSQSSFDLIVAQLASKSTALQQIVLELSMLHNTSALVLCPQNKTDTLSYQYRDALILTLSSRTSKTTLAQIADYLGKSAQSQRRLLESLNQEKRKLQDEKLVSQAKMQLVLMCHWSEEKAHQYILKTAMDHSMTKAAAARQILRKLERISADESQKNKRHASS
ncbi:MAG: ANTAR domain-containing protein [Allobaculum sp.]|nr:ANTAR domain-containing protein [Allobaculum sp.]